MNREDFNPWREIKVFGYRAFKCVSNGYQIEVKRVYTQGDSIEEWDYLIVHKSDEQPFRVRQVRVDTEFPSLELAIDYAVDYAISDHTRRNA